MENPVISRSYSDKFTPGSTDTDLLKNRNVDYISGPFAKLYYVISIAVVFVLFHTSQMFSAADIWMATSMVHAVVTFVLFHWVKGCPDDTTQGEYNGLTLYEQMDAGVPWTITKKFLMLVPTILVWVSIHVADYKPIYVLVNSCIFLIVIIAKIPEMHRVRLLGINSTLGVDEPVEVDPTVISKKTK